MRKLFLSIIFILFSVAIAFADDCGDSDPNTWCIPTGSDIKTTIDGDTFCGGVCDKNDTIFIRAGSHGCLNFQDFDGVDGYITITNEDSVTQAVIDIKCNSEEDQAGGILFDGVRYVDFRGDGYSGHTWLPQSTDAVSYGIKILNENVTPEDCIEADNPDACCDGPGSGLCYRQLRGLYITGRSEYVKIGYVEFTDNAVLPVTTIHDMSIGLGVGGDQVGSDWTWDHLEFHHLYLHKLGAELAYIGNNNPGGTVPFTGEITVHDIYAKDIGGEGIIIKGKRSGTVTSRIYNNVLKDLYLSVGTLMGRWELVDETQCTGVDTATGGIFMDCCTGIGVGICQESSYTQEGMNGGAGIRILDHQSSAIYHIYNNYVLSTTAAGLTAESGAHLIYDNIFIDNGKGLDNRDKKAHGIIYDGTSGSGNIQINDNIIIDASDYGIYIDDNTAYANRNWVGGSPRSWTAEAGATINLGTGVNANLFSSNVTNFNYNKWSNDGDYSNDVVYSRDLFPLKVAVNVPADSVLSWKLAKMVTGVTVYYGIVNPPVNVVINNANVTSYDPPGSMTSDTTFYWKILHHGTAEGDVEGDVYSFTTPYFDLFISDPFPVDNATLVPLDATPTISWTNPAEATSVTVYGEKGANPPTTLLTSGSLAESMTVPSGLDINSTYYWRVDVVHAGGTTVGHVYTFDTETSEYSLEKIGYTTAEDVLKSGYSTIPECIAP